MFNNTNKKHGFSLLKLFIPLLLIFVLAVPVYYYVNYSYKKVISNFYSEFDKNNFNKAKSILTSNNTLLTLKKKTLTTDLNKYFVSTVSKVCDEIQNGKILSENAVSIFKEIKNYNVLDSSIDKLILSIDASYIPEDTGSSIATINLAIDEYNKKNYLKSIELLNKVPSTDIDYYAQAKAYISKCKSSYKDDIFANADELIANKYYSKALELLSDIDTNIISLDDYDIQKKINSIENVKAEYLSTGFLNDSEYTSTAILESITTDNINTLNVESKTEYFLYVNLEEQKTYVYRGSKNDWNLYKSFYCSTGIAGEETPKGIYAVSDRGDWFYSDDYDQGGKYWVRFMGDYLFHSLPYDESGTEIVDETLGKAASHGCIRLKLDDAKWIYDNVNDNTKVIIN